VIFSEGKVASAVSVRVCVCASAYIQGGSLLCMLVVCRCFCHPRVWANVIWIRRWLTEIDIRGVALLKKDNYLLNKVWYVFYEYNIHSFWKHQLVNMSLCQGLTLRHGDLSWGVQSKSTIPVCIVSRHTWYWFSVWEASDCRKVCWCI